MESALSMIYRDTDGNKDFINFQVLGGAQHAVYEEKEK
jgi:hypothetical protein